MVTDINSAAADTLIAAGQTGRKLRLIGLVLTATTTTDVQIVRGVDTVIGRLRLLANTPVVLPPYAEWDLVTGEGQALRLLQSGTVQLTGFATWGVV